MQSLRSLPTTLHSALTKWDTIFDAFDWIWQFRIGIGIGIGSCIGTGIGIDIIIGIGIGIIWQARVIFIGPKSDHCLLLSLTHWLTHSLTPV